MAKLILVLVWGAVLWEQTVSADLGNDFPTRRKASLFLQSNAIPGLAGEVSPEEIVPRTIGFSIPGASFVDTELRSTVLGGNYPESNLNIIRPKMPPSPEEDDINAPTIGKHLLNKKLIHLDPVEQLLLSSNDTTANNGTEDELAYTDGADVESKSIAEGLASFLKRLVECKTKLIFCKKKNIISCYLHCLLNNHPILQVVKSTVASLMKTLCQPLGTIFDGAVKLLNKHFGDIKSLNNFLTMLRIVPETFKRFTRLAANAIPAILLKYAKVQGSDLFKTVLNGLESDAKAVTTGTDITTELSNPACPTLDIFNAVQRVVGILYKNPKVVDIFLPGLWMVSKIFNLVTVPLVKVSLQAFGAALSILMGVNCGLFHYIKTGSNSTCEGDDHVKWEATQQELLPPDSGVPVVCGAVPYIPHRMLLDYIFPAVFRQDETTTTTLAPTQANVGGTEEESSAAGVTKDVHWVDEIIKAMDVDDAA